MLNGRRVLVTGAAGRVAFPIARRLSAAGNDVIGLARFSDPTDEARLAAHGITPIQADLGTVDVSTLPDVDYVFHAGAALRVKPADWQMQMEVNVQATGRLLRRYRDVEGFVFCSTGSQYAYQGQRPLREDDPPGMHLGPYSATKTAGEQLVQFLSREQGTPCTIIRIFSTYGPEGGAPADRFDRLIAGDEIALFREPPNNYTPIYEDDYVHLGIRALEVAVSPPVVTNWSGSETVSAEDYLAFLGSLVGRDPRIVYSDTAPWSLWADPTHMHAVLGRAEVPWRDGMRRMAAARHPELVEATT